MGRILKTNMDINDAVKLVLWYEVIEQAVVEKAEVFNRIIKEQMEGAFKREIKELLKVIFDEIDFENYADRPKVNISDFIFYSPLVLPEYPRKTNIFITPPVYG